MNENLILANAVADRRAYDAVMATGHHNSLSDQGRALWALIDEWYTRDPEVNSVNEVLLATRAAQAHPGHSDMLERLISDLGGNECPGNFREILLEGRRSNLREMMSIKLMENDDDGFRGFLNDYESLDTMTEAEKRSFVGTDPGALVQAVDEGNRIPLAPAQLNAAIRGGGLPGHHATLFGRPEAGKSLMAINCMVAASRAGYRAGYVENEDPIVTTQLRAAQCACNMTEEEVRSGGPQVRKRLEKAGWYDRMFFRDAASMSLFEIRKWVEENDLDFLVVNQLPGVKVKSDNRVLELETIAKGLREIAKATQTFVLSVTQAGDSGDNKRILRMGDIDWSNTAIQAACDLLIGFGVDDDLEMQNQRMLSLCKNKLGGTHDSILIRIDTERNIID